MIILNQILIG